MKLILADGTERPLEVNAWVEKRQDATPDIRDEMEQLIMSGDLRTDAGERLDPEREKRVRRRLLGSAFEHLPELLTYGDQRRYQSSAESSRWLIPGLWRSGTIPMLGGNHKSGKTTVAADLVASLVVPDRLFLDRFGPALWDGEMTTPDVYLFNAETPSDAMNEALDDAGVTDDSTLVPVHLEESFGGADIFDLTEQSIYDYWAEKLIYCEKCDGSDDGPPDVVIVDGLTAILGGETIRYAQWYAAFRRLMREIGTPNALVIGHTTMKGDHLMGGVEMLGGPDGLWTYWSADPDNPNSKRYFKVQPRLGGSVVPKTEVRMLEGRLTVLESTEETTAKVEAEPVDFRSDVLRRLEEAGPDGVASSELTGGGEEGKARRKARDELDQEGLIVSHQNGRRTLWKLA